MKTRSQPHRPTTLWGAFLVLVSLSLACVRSGQDGSSSLWSISGLRQPTPTPTVASLALPGGFVPTSPPGTPGLTPTPDAPHPLPAVRTDARQHEVQPGETLGLIANQYGIGLQMLVEVNQLTNPDVLNVGQVLDIPAPTPAGRGPAFKIIPDSELVFGPPSVFFDIASFVQSQAGYLSTYSEEVEENQVLSGMQIVERVAREYSVSPRLLLAVLEQRSGWVTKAKPASETINYPIGVVENRRKGLYRQLAYAANNFNRGYYLWRVGGAATWLLTDGNLIPIDPTINAGTAGVQYFYATLFPLTEWTQAVGPQGLFGTFHALFGYPFDLSYEPVIPAGLTQPELQLPIEASKSWAFTGGPHGGWGDGSAWAALDFAPPGDALGCVLSDDWVVAVGNGPILRAGNGAVIQDLDLPGLPADGLEQTGWTILYMHVETRDRVQAGAVLTAGDRIGHPSCEGGVSSGTHVHLARRYNGEWITADQDIPFLLDGWLSSGDGKEYDGFLTRDGQSIEAYAGRSENNGIVR